MFVTSRQSVIKDEIYFVAKSLPNRKKKIRYIQNIREQCFIYVSTIQTTYMYLYTVLMTRHMSNLRHQMDLINSEFFLSTDVNTMKRLPKYDFANAKLNIMPGSHRFFFFSYGIVLNILSIIFRRMPTLTNFEK